MIVTKVLLRSRGRATGQPHADAFDAEVIAADRAAGAARPRQHAGLVEKLPYGTLFEFDAAPDQVRLSVLERDGMWVKAFAQPHVLELAGYRIDAVGKGIDAGLPRALRLAPFAGPWRFRIVFLKAPCNGGLVRAIEDGGLAKVLEPLTPFAVLVETTEAQWAEVLNDQQVRDRVLWDLPLHPALKIAPPVAHRIATAAGPERLIDVFIVFRGDDQVAALETLIQSGKGQRLHARAGPLAGRRPYHDFVASVRADFIERLATEPSVRWIDVHPDRLLPDDERTDAILAGTFGVPDAPGYRKWLTKIGLGPGLGRPDRAKVAICDTGVCATHESLVRQFEGETSYFPAPASDAKGHGTHVAGIAVGWAGGDARDDGYGFDPGLGVAPGAAFHSLKALPRGLMIPLHELESGLTFWAKLCADASRAGASVLNNSWSTNDEFVSGRYTKVCEEFDGLVRNPDPKARAAAQLTIVFSAGNLGPAAKTLTDPKALKNGIVVGASGGARTGIGAAEGPKDVTASSSRGPTQDDRIAPTVVAPGVRVSSARSSACDGDPRSTCNRSRIPTGDEYVIESGTSMAAPHVTGACALLIERWRQVFAAGAVPPSAAMVKALLVNSASDLRGGSSADPETLLAVPDRVQGWGRVDLGRLLREAPAEFVADRVMIEQAAPWFDDSVREVLLTIEVQDPARPLLVTLVWTDSPGPLGAECALVNDLDLEVYEGTAAAPATTYKGNRNFADGYSSPTADDVSDSRNNVECVYVEKPKLSYQIRVSAGAVTDSADEPSNMSAPWQDFALVVDNARLLDDVLGVPTEGLFRDPGALG